MPDTCRVECADGPPDPFAPLLHIEKLAQASCLDISPLGPLAASHFIARSIRTSNYKAYNNTPAVIKTHFMLSDKIISLRKRSETNSFSSISQRLSLESSLHLSRATVYREPYQSNIDMNILNADLSALILK